MKVVNENFNFHAKLFFDVFVVGQSLAGICHLQAKFRKQNCSQTAIIFINLTDPKYSV